MTKEIPTHLTTIPGFRVTVRSRAMRALSGTLPPARLEMAAATVASAFQASRDAAKDPRDYDAVLATPEGIASLDRAIVQAALADIYPGGAYPLAWILPRRARKDAPVELHYSLSHRGISVLAARDGWSINPIPVHVEDTCVVVLGEVEEHVPSDSEPLALADLAGVCVVVRKDGRIFARPWVSRAAIEARMRRSQSVDRKTGLPTWGPWQSDPIAMAQKTAIHYCVARGILPIASASVRESAAEEEGPIQVQSSVVRPVVVPKAIGEDMPEVPAVEREKVSASTSNPNPDGLPED